LRLNIAKSVLRQVTLISPGNFFNMDQIMTKILLCDNGSKVAEATLMLRKIAKNLSHKSGCKVDAVSLQHADSINPESLSNEPAQLLADYLAQQLKQGEKDFIILPLFFGKSRALTSFIPEQQRRLESQFGAFTIRIAEVLYPLPQGDPALAEILYDNIRRSMLRDKLEAGDFVLVDHGSPVPQVTEVRQRVASELNDLLGENNELLQAAMERREGKQYDFNGELLQDLLTRLASSGKKSAIVSLLFLLPGRHAGRGGDIEEICANVMHENPGFNVSITDLVGQHEGIVNLLNERLKALN
jgi:sirohydrochlorin ferrochelatase